jgi:hypothetical protein
VLLCSGFGSERERVRWRVEISPRRSQKIEAGTVSREG